MREFEGLEIVPEIAKFWVIVLHQSESVWGLFGFLLFLLESNKKSFPLKVVHKKLIKSEAIIST